MSVCLTCSGGCLRKRAQGLLFGASHFAQILAFPFVRPADMPGLCLLYLTWGVHLLSLQMYIGWKVTELAILNSGLARC